MKIPALGDLAYYLFRPIVWAVDFTWGTDLHSCDKCAARRQRWNLLPYSRAWAVFAVTSGLSVICWWLTK